LASPSHEFFQQPLEMSSGQHHVDAHAAPSKRAMADAEFTAEAFVKRQRGATPKLSQEEIQQCLVLTQAAARVADASFLELKAEQEMALSATSAALAAAKEVQDRLLVSLNKDQASAAQEGQAMVEASLQALRQQASQEVNAVKYQAKELSQKLAEIEAAAAAAKACSTSLAASAVSLTAQEAAAEAKHALSRQKTAEAHSAQAEDSIGSLEARIANLRKQSAKALRELKSNAASFMLGKMAAKVMELEADACQK